MTTEPETPETDAAWELYYADATEGDPWELATKLERERDDARDSLEFRRGLCRHQIKLRMGIMKELNELREKYAMHHSEAERLVEVVAAAKAVVARWGTPLWKDAVATATFINRLRNALSSQNTDNVRAEAITTKRQDER